MKTYLIYFAQAYPNFRKAEIESLAAYHGITIDLSSHDESTPFLKVELENDHQAKAIIERSILGRGIYELWGEGSNLSELHSDVKERSEERFADHENKSFKFDFIGYMGKRERQEKTKIIESFAYLGFKGPIRMKSSDEIFTVLEEYVAEGTQRAVEPIRMWFGRQIGLSARTENILDKYDLRRRRYIGTTSFDAELSLITCNIAQVGPGKIAYDPFVGTGSFLVAASNFGAVSIGSDIDARVVKGKNEKCNIKSNFKQYGFSHLLLDILTMDFTHNALRNSFLINTIVCDPPYGVREGLKVCGAKNPEKAAGRENVVIDGEKAHLRRDFIPSKKPYELANLLEDLLNYSAARLPVDGRLAFWMPTANDDFEVNAIPQHQNLELLYNLEQEFNKWSRRLLVYVKRDDSYVGETTNGLKSLSIKNFRERYFTGFSVNSK